MNHSHLLYFLLLLFPGPLFAQDKDWKTSVIYQIYPRSFQDSNGDGVGDLKGISSRLDYLKDLGVDIIWLSPIYKSPMVDMGYDVSDYRSVDPLFGTMADFEDLLAQAHARGLKLILDFVPNHSSDQHPWFLDAVKSKSSPYRDYYIWRPAKPDGSPPSNWQSFFGGPAWTKTPETDEYYLHLFTKEQPDLNWDNPQLRQAIYAELRFWLDKGVDGFRLDVIPLISKDTTFPDRKSADFDEVVGQTVPGPRLHAYLQEMHREVFSKYDCFVLGEGSGVFPGNTCDFTSPERRELDMVYHFDVTDLGRSKLGIPTRVKLADLRAVVSRWDTAAQTCRSWNAQLFGNHDQPRAVNRFGDPGRYRAESAKMLAGILLTLRGTPFIYQGDEIGMTNIKLKFDELEDVAAINAARAAMKKGAPKFIVMGLVNKAGRDNARTPMQWSAGDQAGFTSGPQTWLKVNPNHRDINVKSQADDPRSVLSFYRNLLTLRRTTPALRLGDFRDLDPENPTVWTYERGYEGERIIVVANFSGRRQALPQLERLKGALLLLSNYLEPAGAVLRGYEVRVYRGK